MKKIFKQQEEPKELAEFRRSCPDGTWKYFQWKKHRGYLKLKKQLIADQHGLCAYCEIDIKFKQRENEIDDFRVEHFFPKSATSDGEHNYHLDWQNMLGVCHGGSQPTVPNARERFTQVKSERTCDVPKSDKPISDKILNPLEIPMRVKIFRYAAHDGSMLVDEKNCPEELQAKARASIRELNLNSPRLCRLRLALLQTIEDYIEQELQSGQELNDILKILATDCLLPDEDGKMLQFFSLSRWFFDSCAEEIICEHENEL